MVDRMDGGDDRGGVPTIQELIQAQRDTTGMSYRDMADRAAAGGYRVKFQTIQELATTQPKGWPKYADTLRGLSVALDVTERTVVLAFARTFGLEVNAGASLLEVLLPAGTRDIDPGLQQAIAGVVRAAVAARYDEAGETGGDTAPRTTVQVHADLDESGEGTVSTTVADAEVTGPSPGRRP